MIRIKIKGAYQMREKKSEVKGLVRLRKATGKTPDYHCENCGCNRYSKCGCMRKS